MTSAASAAKLAVARKADLDAPLPDLGAKPGADAGDPQIGMVNLFSDERSRFGVWESTPGGWNIENRQGNDTMYLLSGRIRITTLGEEPVELSAGDVLVLPHGWSGRWETLETVRKIFIIAD